MAIVQSFCDSFLGDLLAGRSRLLTGETGHRVALYSSTATLDRTTTQYTTSGEISATGYTAGGALLTIPSSVPTVSNHVGMADFDDVTWSASVITAAGCLIYDGDASTPVADAALVVLNFGGDKISISGDFTIQFPLFTSTAAIIRLA